MIKDISIGNFNNIYDQLPFPYHSYRQWQNEESDLQSQFLTVGSSTANIRARQQWNKFGRELYDIEDIQRHARIISQILMEFKLRDFFVQQRLPDGAWFGGNVHVLGFRAHDMIAYLRSRGISVDFSIWRGAFMIYREIGDFLDSFLDYPFILLTYDLELFSTDVPLAMVINHHLCIQYTSRDSLLIDAIKTRIISEGILEYPDRSPATDGP